MTLLEKIAGKREDERQHRATCQRCRREYTLDPETACVEEYCWWCAARVGLIEIAVVRD